MLRAHGRRRLTPYPVAQSPFIPADSIIDSGADHLVAERHASSAIDAIDGWIEVIEIRRVVEADVKIFEHGRPIPVDRIFNADAGRPTWANLGLGERVAILLVGDGFDVGPGHAAGQARQLLAGTAPARTRAVLSQCSVVSLLLAELNLGARFDAPPSAFVQDMSPSAEQPEAAELRIVADGPAEHAAVHGEFRRDVARMVSGETAAVNVLRPQTPPPSRPA